MDGAVSVMNLCKSVVSLAWVAMTACLASMVYTEELDVQSCTTRFFFDSFFLAMVLVCERISHFAFVTFFKDASSNLVKRDRTELWYRRIRLLFWVRTFALVFWTYVFFYAKSYKFGTGFIVGYAILTIVEYGSAFQHIEQYNTSDDNGLPTKVGVDSVVNGRRLKIPIAALSFNLVFVGILTTSTILYFVECF